MCGTLAAVAGEFTHIDDIRLRWFDFDEGGSVVIEVDEGDASGVRRSNLAHLAAHRRALVERSEVIRRDHSLAQLLERGAAVEHALDA